MTVSRFATTAIVGILAVGAHAPVALAKKIDGGVPKLAELDGLRSGDQLISLRFGGGASAPTVFDAIAVAGNMHISVDGPANCCLVHIALTNGRLRDALESIAAQIDLRYELDNPESLQVWLLGPVGIVPDDGITPPVIVNRTYPVYPQAIRDVGGEGTVIMLVVIRADGTVGDVEVHHHAEGWPALDEAAVAAVRQRTYRPAMKDGCPISVYVPIRVDFRVR